MEKFGVWGLFIHSFIDAIIFPVPAFFTQVSLSVVNPGSALWLATAGFIACLLGTPFGYWIGKSVGHSLLYKLLKREWIDSATAMFQKNGETAILFGAFTPIPFKAFTILAGCLNFPLWRLIAYAAIGRSVKFYVVGILFYYYGRTAEGMVMDVSLYILAAAAPLLAIYLLVRRIVRKRREAKSVQAGLNSQTINQDSAIRQSEQIVDKQDVTSSPPSPAAPAHTSSIRPSPDSGRTFSE